LKYNVTKTIKMQLKSVCLTYINSLKISLFLKLSLTKDLNNKYSFLGFKSSIFPHFCRNPTSISIEFISPAWPYRAVPYRYFAKIPLNLNVTFFIHRDQPRYIEKYAVISIVTINCTGKYDNDTDRYRFYRYRSQKNKTLRPLLHS
jgi:hypothetical protein